MIVVDIVIVVSTIVVDMIVANMVVVSSIASIVAGMVVVGLLVIVVNIGKNIVAGFGVGVWMTEEFVIVVVFVAGVA